MDVTATFTGLLLVCLTLGSYGAPPVETAEDTPTGEVEERGDIRFNYDPESQNFVTVTITKCYLVALTHREREHVHSHQGIEDLELQFMRDWLGKLSETRVYHDDQYLSKNIREWCVFHPHDIFRLERSKDDMTTHASLASLVG